MIRQSRDRMRAGTRGRWATAAAAGTVFAALGLGAAPSRATFPGANGTIAYMRFTGAREDDRTAQIVARAPDGTVRQLTHLAGGAFWPAWSPDGTRIVFSRWFSRQRRPDQLWVMNADGTQAHAVAGGCTPARHCLGDDFPSFSPDGTRIVFVRAYRPLIRKNFKYEPLEIASRVEVMTVAAAGGRPTVIRRWGADPQPWEGAPRFSPDGARLVIPLGTLKHPNRHTHVSTALHVINADGSGGETRITPWDVGAANPDWSPDGSRIVFNSEGGHTPDIYVVRPDGGGLTELLAGNHTGTGVGPVFSPSWSPDGRQILFSAPPRRGNLDGSDIYAMNPDGTGIHPLVTGPRMEARPAWGAAR